VRYVLIPGADLQDHHTISGGWGPWETKFVVTGHEVIGKVVEVGAKVTEFKVGQRVGVGAQVGSCGECKACKNDNGVWGYWTSLILENYCPTPVHGYNTLCECDHDVAET
jgi:alcohol dehydrogenase (NADP+)